ncbi:MAG: sulfotransferase domain-containing protein [Planctomycetota bacterium]|nr:sulfotransferase domain-containing protein [Planctomycetota bacterium]
MTQLDVQCESASLQTREARLPNFLYIGTSKAGSTWIYHVLAQHSRVFIAPCKGAYFFDNHFQNGLEWYHDFFRRAGDEPVIGEISHSYLHSPDAAERIAQIMPAAKLMVCLRDPVQRAFSDYLDSVKNGRFAGTFTEALQTNASLLERGAYATHLARYLEDFGREQIHAAMFDDLQADPQKFADDLFAFLQVEPYRLTATMRQKMMPAARPRLRWFNRLAKRVARGCERVGLSQVRGRAKRSRWLRDLLYRPYATSELPRMDDQIQRDLKEQFRDEVLRVDELLGTNCFQRWGYD